MIYDMQYEIIFSSFFFFIAHVEGRSISVKIYQFHPFRFFKVHLHRRKLFLIIVNDLSIDGASVRRVHCLTTMFTSVFHMHLVKKTTSFHNSIGSFIDQTWRYHFYLATLSIEK